MANRSLRFFSRVSVAVAALVGASGCSGSDAVSDMPDEKSASSSEVDACEAVSAETIEKMGLPPDIATELVDPAKPGCRWRGVNATAGADADLLLWILPPGTEPAAAGTVMISGVEVWLVVAASSDDDLARYAVPCGDKQLVLTYHRNHSPLGAEEALTLASTDLIEAYDCAS